jgi:NosR/NirI family nitrous oxide reductase transcriptional regulator
VFKSQPKSIRPGETVLSVDGKERTVKSDNVFALIGRELPLAFFKRSGIRMEGEKDKSWYLFLVTMLSFFSMLYFGKAGVARNLFQGTDGFMGRIAAYFTKPLSYKLSWALDHYSWYSSLNFYLAWIASMVFIVSGTAALVMMIRRREKYFGTAWNRVKYGYFILVGMGFTWVYFHFLLSKTAGWVEEPTFYYSMLYSVTVLLFGARRMMVKKTRYIRYQMISLAFFQVFFLFVLPFYLFDPLIKAHFSAHSYIMREMFPSGKWSCFGFVLFWPLDMNDFGTSAFWTWFPFVQTFGILFLIVKKWGKGAYCGWICSCGGMAETLGDEYRVQAPHGTKAKRLDNIGQAVLAWAILATAASYAVHHLGHATGTGALAADTFRGAYKLGIDVFFAGVLGLGVYFFMSGRVWCRFGCPLAALMHVYSRFSTYRIFAEKKKCISCNICTKVCHMGIDVMNYANKGIPMNDVECVRCSACVQSCPTEVLSFGQLMKADLDNVGRLETPPAYGKEDWRAGIR